MYLREIRKKKGWTLDKLAKAIGATKGNLSLVENGKIKLKLERAEKISKVLNCSIQELNNKSIVKNKLISIKYFENIFASAGFGQINYEENYTYIDVDSKILPYRKNNDYNNISIIKVKGISMYPTIKEDDLIFVDTSFKEIINNKIYVIKENDSLKVKRISINNHNNKELIVKSDNFKMYPTYNLNIDENPNLIIGLVIATQTIF